MDGLCPRSMQSAWQGPMQPVREAVEVFDVA